MTPAEAFEQARAVSLEPIRRDRERVCNPGLEAILAHLEGHLFDDELSLSRLRRKGGFPAEAWAAFPRELGMDPKAYTIDRKLQGAAWLLRRTNIEIMFVADFAGYSTTTSFDSAFPKWAACAPSEYRQTKQGEAVIEVVADEMESDEFWWKAIFQLLDPGQVKRLFDRLVEWYPFLNPRLKARTKTWRLNAQGLARPEVLYQTVWRAARRLPPGLRIEMLREVIAFDAAEEFFHFLCGKSLEVGRVAPDHGVEVMELALEFLQGRMEELGPELPGLKVLGLARLANASILASDVRSAERHLSDARDAWESSDYREALVEAELYSYEARLHQFRGDLSVARKLLDKAIDLCETRSPSRLLALCLNERALVVGYSGDWAAAIRDLRAVEAVLAYQDEPRLKLMVAGNLALFHVLAGMVSEAETHLARAWELCSTGVDDPVSRLHLFWTQGLIHRTRGDLERAASEFEKARRGFKRLQQSGYEAMAALELAVVRYEQGRFEDVVRLAVTVIPLLKHFQHFTGVFVALKVLRKAVESQQVTRQVLEQVHEELYALWRNPGVDLSAIRTEPEEGRDCPARSA